MENLQARPASDSESISYVPGTHKADQVNFNPIVAHVDGLGPVAFENPRNLPLSSLILHYADFLLNPLNQHIVCRDLEEIGEMWHNKATWD